MHFRFALRQSLLRWHNRRMPYKILDADNLPDGFPLRPEPGWIGVFTRANAPGAMPAGTRCRKVNSEPGDANPDGALGAILGSIAVPELQGGAPFYYVEWDVTPRLAVAVVGAKLAPAP